MAELSNRVIPQVEVDDTEIQIKGRKSVWRS
jgi:hypothetical protein